MHPALKIIGLCLLAVLTHKAEPKSLLVLASIMALSLLLLRANNFLKLVLKVKWLVITMFCIYGVNTPGEYLFGMSSIFAPTYEGLMQGGLQALRLICMVAAVSLLIKTTTRNALLSGIYLCLQPLRLLGLNPERFAVRLWLTLHYVDRHQVVFKRSDFMSILSSIKNNVATSYDSPEHLDITLPKFSLLDYAMLAVMLIVVSILCA